MDTLRIIYTLVVIAAFTVICFWAYGRKSKSTFDEAAELPLKEDDFESKAFIGDKR